MRKASSETVPAADGKSIEKSNLLLTDLVDDLLIDPAAQVNDSNKRM